MKTITTTFMFLALILASIHASAAVRHPFQEKRMQKKLEEDSKDIPLYFETLPDRPYEILREVHAHGLFTKDRENQYTQLRAKTYKIHGDAVIEVHCDNIKGITLSCFGHAVRWTTENPPVAPENELTN